MSGPNALARSDHLIQRWRPKRATPYGAVRAPSVIPIPAIVKTIPKPFKPASGLSGELKVFRSNKSAVSVKAVMPPRCTAVARIPRIAS